MPHLVGFQVGIAGEELGTHRTFNWPVSVGQKMRLQVRALVEGSAANWAFVGRFLHVEDLVYGQSSRLAEAFTALAALERFLFAVDVPTKRDVTVSSKLMA